MPQIVVHYTKDDWDREQREGREEREREACEAAAEEYRKEKEREERRRWEGERDARDRAREEEKRQRDACRRRLSDAPKGETEEEWKMRMESLLEAMTEEECNQKINSCDLIAGLAILFPFLCGCRGLRGVDVSLAKSPKEKLEEENSTSDLDLQAWSDYAGGLSECFEDRDCNESKGGSEAYCTSEGVCRASSDFIEEGVERGIVALVYIPFCSIMLRYVYERILTSNRQPVQRRWRPSLSWTIKSSNHDTPHSP